MKKAIILLIIAGFIIPGQKARAQELKKLTLDQVISIAEQQSPNAMIAKHKFRASYWQFRSYQAQFRPSLTLRGTAPSYSNGFDRIYDSNTGEYRYVAKNTITDNATLSLSQAIGFTGTTIALQSNFINLYDFEKTKRTYTTTPVV